MVFVNNKKFACESCIKGHRSSSCAHADRPLFEIKKKGRPVSQCERCRELRKSKKMHSKCTCNPKDELQEETRKASGSGKSRRFVPIVPALPNGLKDYMEQAAKAKAQAGVPAKPANPRQRVDMLLNPCVCEDVWNCKCRRESSPQPPTGLSALAQAAALFSADNNNTSPPHPRSRSATPPPKPKRTKHHHHHHHHHHQHHHSHTPPLELPPIHLAPGPFPEVTVPVFEEMPPISTITAFTEMETCTCGVECGCPGCSEHRGPENVVKGHGHKDCKEGACMHCVDPGLGLGLGSVGGGGIFNRFLALSTSLPAPGGKVKLPKLECCGGNCGCPDGRCGCGEVCDGCCAEHQHEREEKEKEKEKAAVVVHVGPRLIEGPRLIREKEKTPVPAVRGCCAGKVKV